MKYLKVAAAIVVVVLVVVALVAPIGPLPGFFIGGTPTPVPAQWPDTSGTDEITLRVPGTLPRSVIIWVIEYEGDLYVAGASGSGWVERIGAGSPVEMRLEDNTYSLNAVPVTVGWELVLTAYIDKYRPDYPEIVAEFPSPQEAAGQIAVFKLERS